MLPGPLPWCSCALEGACYQRLGWHTVGHLATDHTPEFRAYSSLHTPGSAPASTRTSSRGSSRAVAGAPRSTTSAACLRHGQGSSCVPAPTRLRRATMARARQPPLRWRWPRPGWRWAAGWIPLSRPECKPVSSWFAPVSRGRLRTTPSSLRRPAPEPSSFCASDTTPSRTSRLCSTAGWRT